MKFLEIKSAGKTLNLGDELQQNYVVQKKSATVPDQGASFAKFQESTVLSC
jgi:hypothetical protein